MSNDFKKEYDALIVEKAELERAVNRRRQKIDKLLCDLKTLYQALEQQKAKDALIAEVGEGDWDLESKAYELWSSAQGVEEMQGIIIALKRKRAAIAAECSDVLSKMKDIMKI